jgi:hypothetical protein
MYKHTHTHTNTQVTVQQRRVQQLQANVAAARDKPRTSETPTSSRLDSIRASRARRGTPSTPLALDLSSARRSNLTTPFTVTTSAGPLPSVLGGGWEGVGGKGSVSAGTGVMGGGREASRSLQSPLIGRVEVRSAGGSALLGGCGEEGRSGSGGMPGEDVGGETGVRCGGVVLGEQLAVSVCGTGVGGARDGGWRRWEEAREGAGKYEHAARTVLHLSHLLDKVLRSVLQSL